MHAGERKRKINRGRQTRWSEAVGVVCVYLELCEERKQTEVEAAAAAHTHKHTHTH